jgi:hypothetical protein
MNLIGISL